MKKQHVIQKTINFLNNLTDKIMEKQDQNMEQVEAKSTNRFAGLGTALAVVFLALVVSSFTVLKKGEVNLAETCFEYTDSDNPTDAQATTPANYAAAMPSITCPSVEATLCGICFEEGDFELDGNDKPLFIDPITSLPTALGEVVLANWNNTGVHNDPITASNGKTVTLLFRAER
ncbi:hypothetical protein SAMN05660841_03625 [Sphingobacterium nematocida]|uniref:Uncharacterized protein n=2 Tax=Sphingobacterium nematocida TaxID=1513896 RepID=A0A1T5FZ57_9SPHI|nr:hypothetical protein SAMN05660841_03625 [Sphingobacterium nematocida]